MFWPILTLRPVPNIVRNVICSILIDNIPFLYINKRPPTFGWCMRQLIVPLIHFIFASDRLYGIFLFFADLAHFTLFSRCTTERSEPPTHFYSYNPIYLSWFEGILTPVRLSKHEIVNYISYSMHLSILALNRVFYLCTSFRTMLGTNSSN